LCLFAHSMLCCPDLCSSNVLFFLTQTTCSIARSVNRKFVIFIGKNTVLTWVKMTSWPTLFPLNFWMFCILLCCLIRTKCAANHFLTETWLVVCHVHAICNSLFTIHTSESCLFTLFVTLLPAYSTLCSPYRWIVTENSWEMVQRVLGNVPPSYPFPIPSFYPPTIPRIWRSMLLEDLLSFLAPNLVPRKHGLRTRVYEFLEALHIWLVYH